MSQTLADHLNLVFYKETFSDASKIAKMIHLHKKGSTLDCNNYCITLSSCYPTSGK